jgi:uncharacterized protein YjbI with pentapeptide repeats
LGEYRDGVIVTSMAKGSDTPGTEHEEKLGRTPSRKGWPRWTGLGEKTLWDWLQLLVVPLMLAVLGFVFSAQQDARQQAIEEQRAQDTALQAYLDQMSTFLVESNLRGSEQDSEVRTLAQARTLTVLDTLDPSRKTQVVRFLIEADLVQKSVVVPGEGPKSPAGYPVISLGEADLNGMELPVADLNGAFLARADLSNANLSNAILNETIMAFANLSNADLSDAILALADLHDADLSEADLSGANLGGVNLSNADLSGANLSGANLSKTYMIGADLSAADLSEADLSEAVVTKEQLDQAESLEGATVPGEFTRPSD